MKDHPLSLEKVKDHLLKHGLSAPVLGGSLSVKVSKEFTGLVFRKEW